MSIRRIYPFAPWLAWVVLAPLGLILVGLVIFTTTDVDDLPLDNPDLWWLGGVVLLASLLCLYGFRCRRNAMRRFSSDSLAALLAENISPSRSAVRAGLFVLALAMLVVAIIGPRWGMYLEKQEVRGIDIVVALDVSRSMLARDVEPNRLEMAKTQLRQQLTERAVFQRTNRMALMAFAGSTSLRLPLTTDHIAFRSKLEQIGIGSAPRGGTSVGEAIDRAVELFARSPEHASKIILLLTDGEDHEGGPVEAAKRAFEEHDIRVFTVAVGDPSLTVGAEVPVSVGGRTKPLLHDGQIVFSKPDVTSLRAIAKAGGGRYAQIRDLHGLVDAIAGMRKTFLGIEERKRHQARYQWFLAMAVLLLGCETMIRERRSGPTRTPMRVWQKEATA